MWRDGAREAAAFFSSQLRRPKQRYYFTELEALALASTLSHFSYYLYGRHFMAYTDHKPLCHLLTSDRLNPRLRRIALKLQHWLIDAQYLPGNENGYADALSREEWKRMSPASHRTDASLAAGDQPPQEAPKRETL